jgi:hypothetical protein
MSEIPEIPKSQQELKEIIDDMEHAPRYHDSLSNEDKVKLRLKYELKQCKSGPLNLFFQNIAVICPRLSSNQMEKLRRSFGTIHRDFFERTNFIQLLNAAVSPLFNTQKYKKTVEEAQAAADEAQAAAKTKNTDEANAFAECMAAKARVVETSTDKKYKGTGQIMLFSGDFDGMILERKRYTVDKTEKRFSKFKCCIEKYDPAHLKLAEAILKVAIFILQVLLPPASVYDKERYKQHLHDIGICEDAVDELEYDRYRYIDEFRHLSYKIEAFFRNGMINKLSVPPKPKAFHQDVVNCLKENQDFMKFLCNTCDECQRPVDHLGLCRREVRCTECGGECPILREPTPAPAQASDPLRALATELIDATISFGPDAEQFARNFLGKGIFQLSELSFLGEETFASIVKEIGLNEVQVFKLSSFRKK